jgi:hypothetical protein
VPWNGLPKPLEFLVQPPGRRHYPVPAPDLVRAACDAAFASHLFDEILGIPDTVLDVTVFAFQMFAALRGAVPFPVSHEPALGGCDEIQQMSDFRVFLCR